ncbi:MAG TPA: hypothetical protein DCZ94_06600 [Lentisphaeria bacterium]|nr:MAG: hypothetical protein A2X48_10780 [Lentisphaerae bacterium GWF2_49_21]HBC86605.1 hypothetical protein [Lentisphaeria bacterium]
MSMSTIQKSFIPFQKRKRYLAMCCEIIQREACFCAARSENIIDLQFISQGYHDLESCDMAKRLQDHINSVDHSKYDAILMGFALCNNGIVGLKALKIPLVVPKAHDCITLFLGSKERYDEYFNANPGTYYLTSGWMERDSENLVKMEDTVMSKLGLDRTYEDYVAEYGKETADYLMETLGGGLEKHYDKVCFIDMGVAAPAFYREQAKKEAEKRNFKFEELKGDLRLIQNLFDARWDSGDFLTVKPGEEIKPSYDCGVLKCG